MTEETPRLRHKELFRTVQHLFPAVDIVLSPEELAFFRALPPFAFTIDRQSLQRVLADSQKTGQETRVRKMMATANQMGLYLPEPVEREHRREGELQFVFDRRFWYVDGESKNATGHSASPYVRPELWRGYKTAIHLAEAGCPPIAFIVGEQTRFFRDEVWLEGV